MCENRLYVLLGVDIWCENVKKCCDVENRKTVCIEQYWTKLDFFSKTKPNENVLNN